MRPGLPAGLRSKPVFFALWALGLTLVGGLLLQLGYNPSHGAKIDFERYHYPTVQLFRELDFRTFLSQMHTASGPLYYAVVSPLGASEGAVRGVTLLMHVASTCLFLSVAWLALGEVLLASLLTLAFYLSPFQMGPALWAHPETLATLLVMLGLVLEARCGPRLGAVLVALSTTCRQTDIGIIGVLGLRDVANRSFQPLVWRSVLALALLALLAWAWGGLTPPGFVDQVSPNARTFWVSLVLLAVALCSGDVGSLRPSGRQFFVVFLPLAVVCGLSYNLSGPFDRGGFVFGVLDHLEAPRWPWRVLSPLLASAMLAFYWRCLWRQPQRTLSMLGLACVLAVSNVFYVKYVDFYVWPVGMSVLLSLGKEGVAARRLAASLIAWSAANLVLVTLRY